MKVNEGSIDRVVRIVAGLVLILLAEQRLLGIRIQFLLERFLISLFRGKCRPFADFSHRFLI